MRTHARAHRHTSLYELNVMVRVCFPDPASAGAGRGSRCDNGKGAELRHHLTGEREDHRAGVQEPAVLPEAQGGQRHSG